MPKTSKSRERLYAKLSEEQQAELDEIERHAFLEFNGQIDELEKAIGILRIGHHVGWKVLVLGHSKRTIRKYENMLGITFREFFPPEGPSTSRSVGYKVAQTFDNFWKVVSGETKIDGKGEIARHPVKGT